MTEEATENTEALRYEETLGYQVGMRRIERNLLEKDLAEQVSEIIENNEIGEEITAEKIRAWEQNHEMVSEELLDSLIKVLIQNNDNIDDKDAAKVEFIAAYERTKLAFDSWVETGTWNDVEGGSLGDEIFKLRQSIGEDGITESKLARSINRFPVVKIDEDPKDINSEMILRIQANAYSPSKGLMLAIVKAFDKIEELNSEEKQALLDSYEGQKTGFVAQIISSRSSEEEIEEEATEEVEEQVVEEIAKAMIEDESSVARGTTEAIDPFDESEQENKQPETYSQDELHAKMMVAKGMINDTLYDKDNNAISGSEIHRNCHIPQPVISQIIGRYNRTVPSFSEETFARHKQTLVNSIRDLRVPEENIEQFKIAYDNLQAVTMAIRGKKSPVGSLDFEDKTEEVGTENIPGASLGNTPSKDLPNLEKGKYTQDELGAKLMLAKGIIHDLFVHKDGSIIADKEIAEKSQLSGHYVSMIMGRRNQATPSFSSERWDEFKEKFSTGLRKFEASEDDISKFREMFDNLRSVATAIRGKESPVGNLDFDKSVESIPDANLQEAKEVTEPSNNDKIPATEHDSEESLGSNGEKEDEEEAAKAEKIGELKVLLSQALQIGHDELSLQEVFEATEIEADVLHRIFDTEREFGFMSERAAGQYMQRLTDFLEKEGLSDARLEEFQENFSELVTLTAVDLNVGQNRR